ncbi:hypothetical protein Glove_349g61 [Diversispora epigaea]|uniref:Uncharacterized protein n=1 Tax=Diversispora epigaea TaxID=1348612 RepID=A0A397HEK9_9GLOM|nr:hypothetical protein Glove_349g61 [Diversispora epigaea]
MNENNGNNNTNQGNDNNLPSHLKRIYDTLNRRQKELYNNFSSHNDKINFLEELVEERKKSEIGTELMGVVLYTLITCFIVLIYGLFFKDEKSTKYFVVLLNTVYYIAKIVILGTNMERVGIIYDNKVRVYTSIPLIMWTSLAILLGAFVISPAITITLVNVGLEIAKLINRNMELGTKKMQSSHRILAEIGKNVIFTLEKCNWGIMVAQKIALYSCPATVDPNVQKLKQDILVLQNEITKMRNGDLKPEVETIHCNI